jgi:hypothetical protein
MHVDLRSEPELFVGKMLLSSDRNGRTFRSIALLQWSISSVRFAALSVAIDSCLPFSAAAVAAFAATFPANSLASMCSVR